MTERKPTGMTFSSWIDQQITEAAERGAFDDLPGSGRPLPRRQEADDGQAWLRDYLRREGIAPDVLLPEPLKLLKEREQLAAAAAGLRTEQDVRDAAADLNGRIRQWRRIPVGPPVFVPLVDEDALLARWREAHTLAAAPATGLEPAPAAPVTRRRRRGRRHRA